MIKRLHELSKAELTALGVFMRGEIQPASITEGNDWVCKWFQQGRWSDKQIEHRVELDKEDKTYRVWVAFDGAPIGLCSVAAEADALLITTFLVETAGKTEAEQFVVADALALRSLEGLAKREVIYGWFPKEGFAARYAERCGFESKLMGKPMKPDPNPILYWWMNPTKLRENIEKWQQP